VRTICVTWRTMISCAALDEKLTNRMRPKNSIFLPNDLKPLNPERLKWAARAAASRFQTAQVYFQSLVFLE